MFSYTHTLLILDSDRYYRGFIVYIFQSHNFYVKKVKCFSLYHLATFKLISKYKVLELYSHKEGMEDKLFSLCSEVKCITIKQKKKRLFLSVCVCVLRGEGQKQCA